MAEQEKRGKGRSRVFFAVLSVICPGLGQIVRGRVFTGLLFFLNVALYFLAVVVKQEIDYNILTPAFVIATVIWCFSALDAFLVRSSFLVLALLVSLFCFGTGFLGAYFVLPHLDI